MTQLTKVTKPLSVTSSVGCVSSVSAVLAAYHWRTNAELVIACRDLGYLHEVRRTIDPTYGRGKWWTRWRPTVLVAHDINIDGVDFRKLPEDDNTFDAATFDPPYVAIGGRQTSRIPDFNDRYGLRDAPRTPAALLAHNIDGLAELHRVVRPRGYVLVKAMDYVTSGKLFHAVHKMHTAAEEIGFEVVDRLEHLGKPRPQPPRPRQVHARRNLSTLLVLRKPR